MYFNCCTTVSLWINKVLSKNTFSQNAEASLDLRHPVPLYMPVRTKKRYFLPPAVGMKGKEKKMENTEANARARGVVFRQQFFERPINISCTGNNVYFDLILTGVCEVIARALVSSGFWLIVPVWCLHQRESLTPTSPRRATLVCPRCLKKAWNNELSRSDRALPHSWRKIQLLVLFMLWERKRSNIIMITTYLLRFFSSCLF